MALSGANFSGANVMLDRNAVTPLSQTDNEIRIRMPAHENGYVVIAVRKNAAAAFHEFLYIPPDFRTLAPGGITTIAGVGLYDHAFGPAKEAMIYANYGAAFDSAGRVYVCDPGANRVYAVNADGFIERFAGSGSSDPSSDDGEGRPAVDVAIGYPRSVALDGAGNVYIPDTGYRIRKVTPDGLVHNLAGTGTQGLAGEHVPARGTAIGSPTLIAADKDDLFFIEDMARVRRVHFADGTISTFVADGNFKLPTNDDGALLIDAARNLWLLDRGNGRIRRADRSSGAIETVLEVRDASGNPLSLSGFTVDREGNIYYTPGIYIVKTTRDGKLLKQFGDGLAPPAFSPDGTAADSARFGQINYLGIDPAGNLVFSDSSVGRMRRINFATGRIETIAGMRPAMYAENGPATAAILNFSNGGDADLSPNGELLIADTGNSRIRRLDANGNLTTIAGNGFLDFTNDNVPALSTGLVPLAIHTDRSGIDVTHFGKLLRLDANGVFHSVTTFLPGGSACLYSGDGGPAIAAGLCQPWDTARDSNGNLFVADTNNNRIRRIDSLTGRITTFAGNGAPPNGAERYGAGRECGDGGPALAACFNTPYGLVFDNEGNLLVADNWNTIRKIDTAGIVSTLVRAPATKLRTDRAGSLFGVGADFVWRFDRQGKLTTLAGGNGFGFDGDGGAARSAKLSGFGQSQGLSIDGEGNLFFVDAGNQRVRAIRYGAVLAPPGASVTATASGTTIRAFVRHSDGTPAPSVRVDFSAPTTGASCAWSSTSAVTDANGVASVVCNSNCIAGSFTATAQPLTASATATVSLTNAGGPCRRRAIAHGPLR